MLIKISCMISLIHHWKRKSDYIILLLYVFQGVIVFNGFILLLAFNLILSLQYLNKAVSFLLTSF